MGMVPTPHRDGAQKRPAEEVPTQHRSPKRRQKTPPRPARSSPPSTATKSPSTQLPLVIGESPGPTQTTGNIDEVADFRQWLQRWCSASDVVEEVVPLVPIVPNGDERVQSVPGKVTDAISRLETRLLRDLYLSGEQSADIACCYQWLPLPADSINGTVMKVTRAALLRLTPFSTDYIDDPVVNHKRRSVLVLYLQACIFERKSPLIDEAKRKTPLIDEAKRINDGAVEDADEDHVYMKALTGITIISARTHIFLTQDEPTLDELKELEEALGSWFKESAPRLGANKLCRPSAKSKQHHARNLLLFLLYFACLLKLYRVARKVDSGEARAEDPPKDLSKAMVFASSYFVGILRELEERGTLFFLPYYIRLYAREAEVNLRMAKNGCWTKAEAVKDLASLERIQEKVHYKFPPILNDGKVHTFREMISNETDLFNHVFPDTWLAAKP